MHVSISLGSKFMDLLYYRGCCCKSIVTDEIPRMHHTHKRRIEINALSPPVPPKYRLACFQPEWIGVTR